MISKGNKKKKVAVLVGGPSDEHEVSLESGNEVLKNLPREKYEGRIIVVSREGEWELPLEDVRRSYDLAFIAMHGSYGEDGTVQRMLEEVGMPYTGSTSSVSALGMNKFMSLRIFKAAGFTVPPTQHFTRNHWNNRKEDVVESIVHHLDKPWILKPNSSGSSVGVKIVKKESELPSALDFLFREFKEVIVQKYIEGKEVTCGVLDYGSADTAFPLLPTEIVPIQRDFFDYKAKYDTGCHEYVTPARIPAPYLKEVRKIALSAHKLVGARHFSRTDMIIGKDKKIYVLEINTIPGFTEISLLPQEAKHYGISFVKLLDMVLESAFKTGNESGKKRAI